MTVSSRSEQKYLVKKCRICGGENLEKFLTLESMPIPNGFLLKEELENEEPHYPLGTYVCQDCSLIQLTHVIPADIMFKNYLYIPSTSKTMTDHFKSMANELCARFKVKSGDLVVDIGSNDGTMLRFFKENEADVLGIDPASNLAFVARLNGINTIDDFFTKELAEKVVKQRGHAKVITATNVIAHVDSIHNVFEGVEELLDKKGIFVGEFPYAVDMIKKNEFDTIYHEHLSYFTVKSLMRLFEQHDLKLVDIQKQAIHGGSIRVFVTKKGSPIKPSKEIDRFLKDEKEYGLDTLEPYQEFAQRVEKIREDLLALLKKLKKEGKKIVGYGAAAKGNVMLNYCKIGPELLDYVVDSVSYKQGRYTPGTHIPIFSEKKIESDMPDYVLILAWNFADEIMAKQQEYRQKGGQFIITIPTLRVE